MTYRNPESVVLKKKHLDSGEILKIVKVQNDELTDNPENDMVLMLHQEGHRTGIKFAPAVSHLLSPDLIYYLFERINFGEEFVILARQYIAKLLDK